MRVDTDKGVSSTALIVEQRQRQCRDLKARTPLVHILWLVAHLCSLSTNSLKLHHRCSAITGTTQATKFTSNTVTESRIDQHAFRR